MGGVLDLGKFGVRSYVANAGVKAQCCDKDAGQEAKSALASPEN